MYGYICKYRYLKLPPQDFCRGANYFLVLRIWLGKGCSFSRRWLYDWQSEKICICWTFLRAVHLVCALSYPLLGQLLPWETGFLLPPLCFLWVAFSDWICKWIVTEFWGQWYPKHLSTFQISFVLVSAPPIFGFEHCLTYFQPAIHMKHCLQWGWIRNNIKMW